MSQAHPSDNHFDIIIIGAGAAGLMCAGQACRRGRSVLVLDHADRPGKKLLISGGGRCNFTNRLTRPDNFLSANPHFCKSALARFSADDFIAMVEARGIAYHERSHGQLFCDHSARDILDMLLDGCRQARIALNRQVVQVEMLASDAAQAAFVVRTDRESFTAQSLVVATGGLSIPKMGATGFGLKLAEQFGLNIVPPHPGLVPFTFTGSEKDAMRELAGISLDVVIHCRGQSFAEALLFTHRGISGPAVLQASSYWQPGDTLAVDLLPGRDGAAWLRQMRAQRPKAMLSTALAMLLPKRLVHFLQAQIPLPERRLQQVNEAELTRIAQSLHRWTLKPGSTEGYRTAEVTVGGIDTNELAASSMQVKRVPGLYFVGEVVDVTGHLGGFNFQWAWSSGFVAGMHA